MGLSADEKKLLEELTAKSKQPDTDEDFEIEIHDTQKGKATRVPFKVGKRWIFDNFGIGDGPAEDPADEGGEQPPQGTGTAENPKSRGSFFGTKQQ